ncbi:carbohydrate kinase [Leeia sp.]|uniref:carbohydrate kinase family protein n=1 Tax=Leeia sp. TaxID=2884678 RepID=UPI0035B09BBE
MSPLPRFVSAGEALTDLIRTGEDQWLSKTGGAPWNVARVMSRLDVPSAFAGAVSQDVFGDALWGASEEAGLDMRFMQRVARSPLLAMVYETHPPAYFFVGDQSADLAFDPERLPVEWLGAVEWGHFGGISLAREPLADRLLSLVKSIKQAGGRISYDPNFRQLMDARYDPMLQQMCRLADVIKVSDEDLQGLFRHDDTSAALRTIRLWNANAAILYTRGAAGAELLVHDEHWRCAPPAITVVDTVGAGDASMGGLLYSLMQQPAVGWLEHLACAVAAGAAACLVTGATAPTVARLKALRQRVSVTAA